MDWFDAADCEIMSIEFLINLSAPSLEYLDLSILILRRQQLYHYMQTAQKVLFSYHSANSALYLKKDLEFNNFVECDQFSEMFLNA